MDQIQLPSDVEIARRLGGEVIGPGQIICPGPGHSRDDRSLHVTVKADAPGDFRVSSYADDEWNRCKDYVRQALDLAPWEPARWIRPVAAPVPRLEDDSAQRAKIAAAGTIWASTSDPRGTPVERYLKSRGLWLDASLIEVVRYHPALRSEGREHSGMVALFRDIHTNEPCGVHRTFLDRQARKLARKMLGRAKGATIKLDADDDVTVGLHIGEGVETCLTARQQGFRPVWALGSVGAIASFPVLAGIEALTILAEHDDSGANRRAIQQCSERYQKAGCEVWVIDPPGGDLNDIDRGAA